MLVKHDMAILFAERSRETEKFESSEGTQVYRTDAEKKGYP